MLQLICTKKTDSKLKKMIDRHYTHPKGFVGRSLCYAIFYDNQYYGHIVAGSCVQYLPGRQDFIGDEWRSKMNNIVNNTFFHIEPQGGKYPVRNFSQKVLSEFRKRVLTDWFEKYGDEVIAFETLIYPEILEDDRLRNGGIYLRDGWEHVGVTKGKECKRIGGKDKNEKFGGVRVWDDNSPLRPKIVLMRQP